LYKSSERGFLDEELIDEVGFSLLVLSAYTLKVTGHPKFCTSCHNMDDYYDSWQHSSHKDVACIGCHYEPGVTATMVGKIEGLVQVVKYVSHSYTNKPHAMISNESCTRDGCHADMDNSRETLIFRGKIRFRHDKHLAEHPRGQVLNCVSCHGHAVEGQHLSVTETTCVTCHFYGRGNGSVAAGKCLTCHQTPEKPVVFMGQRFEHRKFLKDKTGVRCAHCHSQVTQGDGAVSSTRCRSCHLGKTPKTDDPDKFHLIHVSKGHFECLQCHDEIKHGIRPMAQQLLAKGNCRTCHAGDRHSLQEKLYAGVALLKLKGEPDPMYKAGVACDGCHTDSRAAGAGVTSFTKKLSGTKQCADCHGNKRYGQMLTGWQNDTRERLESAKQEAIGKKSDAYALIGIADNGIERVLTITQGLAIISYVADIANRVDSIARATREAVTSLQIRLTRMEVSYTYDVPLDIPTVIISIPEPVPEPVLSVPTLIEAAAAKQREALGITLAEVKPLAELAQDVNIDLGGSYIGGMLKPPQYWTGSVTEWSKHVQA
ncbi:hypothetical protein LCGC14_2383500, partial [marine sediment metagenome]